MRAWLLIPLALALSACQSYNRLNGCWDWYLRPDTEGMRRDYAASRALWERQNIRSYAYTKRLISWMPPSRLRVEVEDGAVRAVTQLEPTGGTPQDPTKLTMERQFDIVGTALAGPLEPCGIFGAAYDPATGRLSGYHFGTARRDIADGIGGGFALEEFEIRE